MSRKHSFPFLSLVLALSLVLVMFVPLSAEGGVDKDAWIEVPRIESDRNIFEFPYIYGAVTDAANQINAEIQTIQDEFQEKYPEEADPHTWSEVLAYPTETDEYLNLVINLAEYPTYGTYGQAKSWVYDKVNGKEVTLDEALQAAGVSQDKILSDINAWVNENGEGNTIPELVADSFIHRAVPGGWAFTAGIATKGPGAPETWVQYYSWCNGTVEDLLADPVDPKEIEGTYEVGTLQAQKTSFFETGYIIALPERDRWEPCPFQLEPLYIEAYSERETSTIDEINKEIGDVVSPMIETNHNLQTKDISSLQADGDVWHDLFGYPVSTSRYLNLIMVRRENQKYLYGDGYYEDQLYTKVYDRETEQEINLTDIVQEDLSVIEADIAKAFEDYPDYEFEACNSWGLRLYEGEPTDEAVYDVLASFIAKPKDQSHPITVFAAWSPVRGTTIRFDHPVDPADVDEENYSGGPLACQVDFRGPFPFDLDFIKQYTADLYSADVNLLDVDLGEMKDLGDQMAREVKVFDTTGDPEAYWETFLIPNDGSSIIRVTSDGNIPIQNK